MPSFLLEALKRKIMVKCRKRRQKKRKLKKSCHVDWSNIPGSILEMIAERLSLIDCLSVSKVCKSWNNVLGEELPCWIKRGFPWLLVSGEEHKEIRNCISVLENRVLELKLLEAHGKYCWGSFHHWLIMVKDMSTFSLEVNLLNPFSGSQISLPGIWNLYHKMVLSGFPSENNFVCLLLHSQYRELAFWIPGEQSWYKYKLTGDPFEDAIFFNGSFYLLVDGFNIWQIDVKSIYSSISEGCDQFGTLSEIQITELKMAEMQQIHEPSMPERNADDHILKYLVESSGEILLVCRYFSDDILETRKFEVYSLDFCQSSWKKIEDLGDRMLFLGKCSSMSFSAKELGVGMNNSIYFSNDPATPWWNEWDSYHLRGISARLGLNMANGRDWGIFRLHNENGEAFRFHGDADHWAYTWFNIPSWWCFKNIPFIEES
ncbi:hypothetical protein L6164_001683 [Bauhinia variegata]|uniref:Uncharacterized protein n=1 Tax=Bauhinia variegata TaxID=167791 RepID=A0ACB9QCN9_BAUVA|nr:hypothetical protein L6164_001683 [Bauhinia variegata]